MKFDVLFVERLVLNSTNLVVKEGYTDETGFTDYSLAKKNALAFKECYRTVQCHDCHTTGHARMVINRCGHIFCYNCTKGMCAECGVLPNVQGTRSVIMNKLQADYVTQPFYSDLPKKTIAEYFTDKDPETVFINEKIYEKKFMEIEKSYKENEKYFEVCKEKYLKHYKDKTYDFILLNPFHKKFIPESFICDSTKVLVLVYENTEEEKQALGM